MRQTSTLFLHQQDARRRGISTGDRVQMFNDRGSCILTADVNGAVREGVVWAPSVRWGRNVNALTSDRLTDIGGGPTFYSCLVEVAKCGD
jgi:anaerobic selenocysteine-containing dehydrogenase